MAEPTSDAWGGALMSDFLSMHELTRRTGMTFCEIHHAMRKNGFPQRIIVSERYSGWSADEVQDWLLKQLEAQARRAKA